jgi:hypothetical protein
VSFDEGTSTVEKRTYPLYPVVHLINIRNTTGARVVEGRVVVYAICFLDTHDPVLFAKAVEYLVVYINGLEYRLDGEITDKKSYHIWEGTAGFQLLDTTPHPSLFRQHISVKTAQYMEESRTDFFPEEGPPRITSGEYSTSPTLRDPYFYQTTHRSSPSSVIPGWDVTCVGTTKFGEGYGFDFLFEKKKNKSTGTYTWLLLSNVFLVILVTFGLKYVLKVLLDKWLCCFFLATFFVAVGWAAVHGPVLGPPSELNVGILLNAVGQDFV